MESRKIIEKQTELKEMYQQRFDIDADYRKKLYAVLCHNFFQKYISKENIVMEVAAGYCEFINTIKANKKIALDLNPDVKNYANSDVEVLNGLSTDMNMIDDESLDTIYVSNFFEHISREDIVKTLSESYKKLRVGGEILILQPNFRYCMKDYYMFFDHITPVDDRALCEVLTLQGFQIKKCLPKFLPYTTKSRLPKWLWLVRLYLMLPFAYSLFGQQAFIIAKKGGQSSPQISLVK